MIFACCTVCGTFTTAPIGRCRCGAGIARHMAFCDAPVCGAFREVRAETPEAVRNELEKLGWRTRDVCLCPNCEQKRRER